MRTSGERQQCTEIQNILKFRRFNNNLSIIQYMLQKVEMVSVVQRELEKIPRWKLLMYLGANEEKSVSEISRDLEWEPKKTHSIIANLLKTTTIKARKIMKNGRAVKLVKIAEK